MPHRPDELDTPGLVAFLDSLSAHEVRLVLGTDAADFSDRLALQRRAPDRPVLLFGFGDGTAESIIEAAIAQMARVVGDLWPFLWDGEDLSSLQDDVLGRAHLPIRLGEIALRVPGLSPAWARDAVLSILRGGTPRTAGCPPDLEWSQLVAAFSRSGLTLATAVAAPRVGEAWLRAVEWLARHAAVALVVLLEERTVGPALERLAFGRVRLGGRGRPADPIEGDGAEVRADRPIVLAVPPAEGRPHPLSVAEMRLCKLIQEDRELRPLFAFNRTLEGIPLLQVRADLAWIEGRVVVEIDGAEHRGAVKYREDRHRDYKLMCAGYRVLRMTNEDVMADAALVVEKIRDVVNFARKDAR